MIGSAWILLSVPLALLGSRFGGDAETLLHMSLGAGLVITAFALFDFRTARWVSGVAGLGLGMLGAIFLLQGTSDLIPGGRLHALAYDVLGQTLERVLPDLFILWSVATLVQHSRGGTRRFGACIIILVVAADVLDYAMTLRGGDAPGILKVLFLLPFVWLLVEGRKPRIGRGHWALAGEGPASPATG